MISLDSFLVPTESESQNEIPPRNSEGSLDSETDPEADEGPDEGTDVDTIGRPIFKG